MNNYSLAQLDMKKALLEAADMLEADPDRTLGATQVALEAMWRMAEQMGGQEAKALSLQLQAAKRVAWGMGQRAERVVERVEEVKAAIRRQRVVLEAARRAAREALLSPKEDRLVEEAVLEWMELVELEGHPPLARLPRQVPAAAAKAAKREAIRVAQAPAVRHRRARRSS